MTKENFQKTTEITWFSRGGQGAKTSALLFGEAALAEGYFIQAFPEYGPERAGAPMRVYNRISDDFIRYRIAVKDPDIIIVLDQTLLKDQVSPFFNSKATFLINVSKKPEAIKKELKIKGKVFTIDASPIAIKYLGRPLPSVVMLGALVGLLNFDLQKIIPELEIRLKEKINPKLVGPNLTAIKESYKIIKG